MGNIEAGNITDWQAEEIIFRMKRRGLIPTGHRHQDKPDKKISSEKIVVAKPIFSWGYFYENNNTTENLLYLYFTRVRETFLDR